MRVRTAKQRAQRIDLNYFKHANSWKRWRALLSVALPAAALLWVSVYAAAGNRTPYSPGPVSTAHAFAEMRCEVCHSTGPRDPRAPRPATIGFRAHTTDAACLTCHDAPVHAVNQTTPQACATCHRDHAGRVALATVNDGFCVECHGDLRTAQGLPKVATAVSRFPSGHPEFAAVKAGATDPGRLRFNHAVHLKDTLRGPGGVETLACAGCHTPDLVRTGAKMKGPANTGLMTTVTYERNCARCHPLFFDERIEQMVPHVEPIRVRAFVQQALAGYIREHPDDIFKSDSVFRRVPLNFPRPPEPPARNAEEWVARRIVSDERLLWNKTCAECHDRASTTASAQAAAAGALPVYAATAVTKHWMPRATFNHTPHQMVTCASCHAAQASTKTSDVLLPDQAICATCHAPARGALRQGSGQVQSRCVECHPYHDWTKSHPVTPSYSLTDFK